MRNDALRAAVREIEVELRAAAEARHAEAVEQRIIAAMASAPDYTPPVVPDYRSRARDAQYLPRVVKDAGRFCKDEAAPVQVGRAPVVRRATGNAPDGAALMEAWLNRPAPTAPREEPEPIVAQSTATESVTFPSRRNGKPVASVRLIRAAGPVAGNARCDGIASNGQACREPATALVVTREGFTPDRGHYCDRHA